MHVHCPHCRNPIEVVGATARDEWTCPSCGTDFEYDDDVVVTWPDDTNTLTMCGESDDSEFAPPESSPGNVLGHFELEEKLGTGAFGTVWKARDRRLDRVVALKVPRRDQFSFSRVPNGPRDSDDAEKFLREARAAAQLRHPNIVSVHEVGRADDVLYIVSDYVDGASLDEWLQRNRPTPRRSAELCATIAEALQHAHSAGVIHRDLKPANILMSSPSCGAGLFESNATADHDEPHITDFGIAKREAGEITMTVDGQVLGTPAYMSPEQARGDSHVADARSDVYSLGVMLFELLTGERPFGGSVRLLLHQVVHEDARSPRRLNAGVPRDLETICLKCLEKEPGKRYNSARELADDLRRFLNNEPILARPVGRLERAGRWCRRNPTVAGLTAAAVVSVFVGTVVTSVLAIQSEQNAAEARLHKTNTNTALRRFRQEESRAKELAGEVNRKTAEKEDALRLAERSAYNVQLGRANDVLERDPSAARALLDDAEKCPERLRDFTWRLFRRLCERETLTMQGHKEFVNAVALSPNASLAASAGFDHTVKLFNLRTGKEIATLEGHQNSVESVCFSPDGKTLASAGYDETIRLWNLDTRTAVVLESANSVFSLAWSGDGRRLAAAGAEGMIEIWDPETRQVVRNLSGHSEDVLAVAFSPDGKKLASTGVDKTVRLWNADTGRLLAKFEGHTDVVMSLAFSPDGSTLGSSGRDSVIRLWNVASGRQTATLSQHAIWVRSIAFSPDGSTLASDGNYIDYTVTLWDLNTRQPRTVLKGHTKPVTAVCFSQDGRLLLSGSEDGTARLWQAEADAAVTAIEEPFDELHALAYSPDGRLLASAGSTTDPTITVRDAHTGRTLHILQGHKARIYSLTISGDGTRLASTGDDGKLIVWDVAGGRLLYEQSDHTGAVYGSLFAPGDDVLISFGADETIRRRDAHTGKTLSVRKSDAGMVFCAVFAKGGETFFAAANDGTILELETGSLEERRRLTGHSAAAWSLALSPDGGHRPTGGPLVSAATDNTIRMWDLASGKQRRVIRQRRGLLAFSPDGQTLVSCTDRGTIEFWDPVTGQERATLRGHSGWIYSVRFSPDGRTLATAGEDHTLKLWSTTDDPAAPSAMHASVNARRP